MPVRNLAALKAKLAKIPPSVKVAAKTQNTANANEVAALAANLAPRRTGALAASIHVEDGDTEISAKVVAGNSEVFYARFVEFGTRGGTAGDVADFSEKQTFGGTEAQDRRRKVKRTHPGTSAQPFFFPAYRALKKKLKSNMSRATNKAIKAAVSEGGGK